MLGRALGEVQASEMPCHGAVAQADHPVGHTGVDDRLRTDDAAGPARAVHHDSGVRRRYGVVHAVRELGAGAAHPARDAEIGELRRRPAVQDDDVLACREHRVKLFGRDRRRAELVLDHLAECLARDVDAADEGVAGRGPCLDSALQHRDIAIAVLAESGRGSLGFTRSRVAHDDPGGAARHESRRQPLEPRERAAARVEEMRVVERALLAGVEQRELFGVEDPPASARVRSLSSWSPPQSRSLPGAIQPPAAGSEPPLQIPTRSRFRSGREGIKPRRLGCRRTHLINAGFAASVPDTCPIHDIPPVSVNPERYPQRFRTARCELPFVFQRDSRISLRFIVEFPNDVPHLGRSQREDKGFTRPPRRSAHLDSIRAARRHEPHNADELYARIHGPASRAFPDRASDRGGS